MKSASKLFGQLSPSERKRINDYCTDLVTAEIDHAEAEIQKVWIKLGCLACHKCGMDADTVVQWLGVWRNIYRQNKRMKSEEEQAEWIEKELDKVFPLGFPDEFLDMLEEKG